MIAADAWTYPSGPEGHSLGRSLGTEGQSPLAGRQVVNTRSPRQAPQLDVLLRQRGAKPLAYPCLDIIPPAEPAPLQTALTRLGAGAFDWLVFTSANAVEAIATQTLDSPLPAGWNTRTRVAAVGPGTAAAIRELLDIAVDLVPEEHLAEALAARLVAQGARRVLVPQAERARETLAQILGAAGVDVETVVAYRTVLGSGGVAVPQLLRAGQVDAVVFASPSAIHNMATRLQMEGGDWDDLRKVCVACIGPVTAATAEQRGLKVSVLPREHTISGLVHELERFHQDHPRTGGMTA